MKDDFDFTQYLLNISTNIFIKTGADGIINYTTLKAEVLFGIDNIVGINLYSLFNQETNAILHAKITETIKTQISSYATINYQSRHYIFYFHVYGKDIVLCIEDITERVQLSDNLLHTSERLAFAEKTTQLGYWEFDLCSRSLFWSPEIYRLLGRDAKNISHKRNIIRDQIIQDDAPIYRAKLRELLANRRPVDGILRVRKTNGKIIFCSFKAGLICKNNRTKIAGTFQDFTKLIEIQHELEQARKEADASNIAKSYFMAQASHDLRQPMQALKIFISTLEEEHLSKHQRGILNKLGASADNLNNLLDNLMDISKLDSHGFEAQNYGFDIADLLKNILFEFQAIAHKRHITFLHSFMHYTVQSDPFLIERVIRNLLSNAFKYTNNKVLIGCKKEKNNIRIVVIDNGIGIASKEIPLIYDEFFQSNDIPDNQRNGAGLGLSIVKKISDALQLDIQVKSHLGQGSCFSFRLPIINKNPPN